MAALLIGMSVAAILMSAMLPTWKTMARREKEAELVFRGEQYVRAIGLFQRRAGPGVLPPNVDVLVTQKFLRKKYKDPITGQDFDVLSPTNIAGGQQPGQVVGGPAGSPGRGAQPSTPAAGAGAVASAQGAAGGRGGVMGVASRSRETSLRLYNGRSRYNEWQFVFQQTQAPGAAGGPGRGGPPPQGRGAAPGPAGVGATGGRGARGGPFGPPGGGPFGPQGPGRGTVPQPPLAPRPVR